MKDLATKPLVDGERLILSCGSPVTVEHIQADCIVGIQFDYCGQMVTVLLDSIPEIRELLDRAELTLRKALQEKSK